MRQTSLPGLRWPSSKLQCRFGKTFMIVSEVASPGTFSHSSPIDTKVNAIWLKLIEQILIDRYWIKDFWLIFSRLLKDIAWYCNHPCTYLPVVLPALPARSLPVQGPVSLPAGRRGRHVAAPWKTMHDSDLWVQLRSAFSAKPWLFWYFL